MKEISQSLINAPDSRIVAPIDTAQEGLQITHNEFEIAGDGEKYLSDPLNPLAALEIGA